MSATFTSWCWAFEADKEPEFSMRITPEHIAAYKSYIGLDQPDEQLLSELQAAVKMVRDVWMGDSEEGAAVAFEKFNCRVLFTGVRFQPFGRDGDLWSEAPNDLFSAMNALAESGIAEDLGFEY